MTGTTVATPKKKRKPRKIYATNSKYIDPFDCSSKVSYKVLGHGLYMNGEVELSECTRSITWYFTNDSDAVQKIDNAIKELMDFRNAFVKAQKDYPPKKQNAEDDE